MVKKKDRKGVGAMNILMIPPLCNLQLNFWSLPLAFVGDDWSPIHSPNSPENHMIPQDYLTPPLLLSLPSFPPPPLPAMNND